MSERHLIGTHEVLIQLREVAQGHVRWVSWIAGRQRFTGRHTLPSMEMARSEALMQAQITLSRNGLAVDRAG